MGRPLLLVGDDAGGELLEIVLGDLDIALVGLKLHPLNRLVSTTCVAASARDLRSSAERESWVTMVKVSTLKITATSSLTTEEHAAGVELVPARHPIHPARVPRLEILPRHVEIALGRIEEGQDGVGHLEASLLAREGGGPHLVEGQHLPGSGGARGIDLPRLEHDDVEEGVHEAARGNVGRRPGLAGDVSVHAGHQRVVDEAEEQPAVSHDIDEAFPEEAPAPARLLRRWPR